MRAVCVPVSLALNASTEGRLKCKLSMYVRDELFEPLRE